MVGQSVMPFDYATVKEGTTANPLPNANIPALAKYIKISSRSAAGTKRRERSWREQPLLVPTT
jgi:hypothetical protein